MPLSRSIFSGGGVLFSRIQRMLMCRVGAKSVVHLMKFHLLQSEVIKLKFLMNSNTNLTVLNLHQKTDTKVQQDFKGQGHYDKVKGQTKATP